MRQFAENVFLLMLGVVPAVFLYLGYVHGDAGALVLGFITGSAVAFCFLIDNTPHKGDHER